MSRYEGKPFLRLLDCYVLRAIGALDGTQEAALRTMEPKLADLYGKTGAWYDIVADQMEFPVELPDRIRAIWVTGTARAEQQGLVADPNEFTRQFVDTNFL